MLLREGYCSIKLLNLTEPELLSGGTAAADEADGSAAALVLPASTAEAAGADELEAELEVEVDAAVASTSGNEKNTSTWKPLGKVLLFLSLLALSTSDC